MVASTNERQFVGEMMDSTLQDSPLFAIFQTAYEQICEVKGYLVSRQPQADVLNHHAEWAGSILDLLIRAIADGQNDSTVTWDEYAALVWLAYDLSDLREQLEYAMGELPF